jgi:hypothetical protein
MTKELFGADKQSTSQADPVEREQSIAEADLVEGEEVTESTSPSQPWNPEKIRISTKNFSLREVVEQIDSKDIDLAPDFQREFVWKRRQRTRLIESILLGIPLPAFYFNQEDDGSYQVVDGVQRLSSVHQFMDDRHILDVADLEYLHHLHGCKYSDLEQLLIRRFRSSQIVVHIIEPQTPDEIKYDIFGRVNTLGSPLSPQEIRHAMSKSRSRDFLHRLATSSSFDSATDFNFWRKDPGSPLGRVPDTGRMMNRELALRFCAFSDFSVEQYRRFPSLDSYLVNYTRRLDGRCGPTEDISDTHLELLERYFDQAMVNAHYLLGNWAFRRYNPTRRGPINRALFESQAIALAPYSPEQIARKQKRITENLEKLFDDTEYVKAVTVGTGAVFRVDLRLRLTRLAVGEAMK